MLRRFLFSIISLTIIAAVGISLDYATERDVLSGGATSAASADYALDATTGQAVIGLATSADYDLCNGYWCGDLDVAAMVGKATLDYRITFGQAAIVAALLVGVALILAQTAYTTTKRAWGK
jgi:hypothetical protein